MKNILVMLLLTLFIFKQGAGMADSHDVDAIGEQGREAFRQGNLMQAIDLLGKSAAKGYAPAQTTLAYIYDQSEENELAFKFYELAARQNYAPAEFGLGGMYAKGEGVEKNAELAGQWIKKSALQQHVPAMRVLAFGLEAGDLGFERDAQQALTWFQKCHELADPVCTRRLYQAYDVGDLGLALDKKRAGELFLQLNKEE